MTSTTNDKFTSAYRAILTAVFVGIADALISLLFNILYRSSRPDFSQELLNVSYLIFGTLFLFFLLGILFMVFRLLSRRGSLIFTFVCTILTLIAFLSVGSAHLADSSLENNCYRGMLRGLILIDGMTAALLVPFLYSSPTFEANIV